MERDSLQFDVSKENDRASKEWMRSYRLLLWAILLGVVGFASFFSVALVGAFGLRAHIPPEDFWIVATMYGLVITGTAVLAFGIFWLYRPGGQYLNLNSRGIAFVYRDGRMLEWQWSNPNFHMRISRSESLNTGTSPNPLNQIAIQSALHPHFELSEAAFSAIVSAAASQGLHVKRSVTSLPGGIAWERVVISKS
jgi:hypothetical protein